jgi:hypothetical protein
MASAWVPISLTRTNAYAIAGIAFINGDHGAVGTCDVTMRVGGQICRPMLFFTATTADGAPRQSADRPELPQADGQIREEASIGQSAPASEADGPPQGGNDGAALAAIRNANPQDG